MKILNFGSLNIDNVCQVPHFVRPGETLAANSFERFAGGKGLNQSLALARSGVPVCHAGKIGGDGLFLKQILEESGVDCHLIRVDEKGLTGCALIQVSDSGENCIVLYGGTNQTIPDGQIDAVFEEFEKDDILLIQNEVNSLDRIIKTAAAREMKIFFNPAPMRENISEADLDLIHTFIVNEIEGAELSGCGTDAGYREILSALRQKFPQANILMTLGAQGAIYASREDAGEIFVPACRVERVVDTTAAGDTFIGYFLSVLVRGGSVRDALETASKASAHCITIKGAANSIPFAAEL